MVAPVTYSWIGISATAPVLVTLLNWVLGLFRSFRSRWEPVDVFLVAILAEDLVSALLSFSWALSTLFAPGIEALCSALVLALTTTRTLQVATVVSMVTDRLLASLWPYRYRCSVRRNQVRYHVAVVSVISLLVGMATVLAPRSRRQCSFLPHEMDPRFARFFIGLQCILLVTLLAGAACVHCGCSSCRKSCGPAAKRTMRFDTAAASAADPVRLSLSNSSANSTATKTSILTTDEYHGSHHQHQQQQLRNVYYNLRFEAPPPLLEKFPDCRWTVVLAVAILSHAVSHLPFLVVSTIGIFFEDFLPDWPYASLAMWLSLADGFLTAVSIIAYDVNIRSIIRKHYFKDKYMQASLDQKYDFFHPASSEIKFPLTNGSLISGIAPRIGVKGTQFLSNKKGLHHHLFARQVKRILTPTPRFHSWEDKKQAVATVPAESLNASTANFSPSSAHSPCSTNAFADDEQQAYSTLSNPYGTLSSSLRASSKGCCDELYCTTAANDDFIFHSGTDLRRRSENDLASDKQLYQVCAASGGGNASVVTDRSLCRPLAEERLNQRTASMNDLDLLYERHLQPGSCKTRGKSHHVHPERVLQRCYAKRYPVNKNLTRLLNPRDASSPLKRQIQQRQAARLSGQAQRDRCSQTPLPFISELFHHQNESASVPDFRKMFVTGYL